MLFDDPDLLRELYCALARSVGMSQLARELGVTREGLYKSLSLNGHPSFETVIKLLYQVPLRYQCVKLLYWLPEITEKCYIISRSY